MNNVFLFTLNYSMNAVSDHFKALQDMSSKGKVSQVGRVIDGRFNVIKRIGAGKFLIIFKTLRAHSSNITFVLRRFWRNLFD